MSAVSVDDSITSFTVFPQLPTELRLKIWSHVVSNAPPQLLTFSLYNSDLDYLRLNRKACHDYQHICARKSRTIPTILHVCHEARSVGMQHYSLGFFDGQRILSLGRGDTDMDTYTTCSHEVSTNEGEGEERGLYWDFKKDVVFLDSSPAQSIDKGTAAYIWGGKTGIKFGKMGKVAMTYETLIGCGIAQNIVWDSIDLLLVISDQMSNEEMKGSKGNWVWKNEKMDGARYISKMLASRGLYSSEGGEIDVKFEFRTAEEAMKFVATRKAH